MFHRNIFKTKLDKRAGKGKRSCSLSLKMLSHFFTRFSVCQKYGTENFAVCGRRPKALPLESASLWKGLSETFIRGSPYCAWAGFWALGGK